MASTGWSVTSWFSSWTTSSSSPTSQGGASRSISRSRKDKHCHTYQSHQHHPPCSFLDSSGADGRGNSSGSSNSRSGLHSSGPHSPYKQHPQPRHGSRKILCRYGMGCTHVLDPIHAERFWHPPVPGEGLPLATYEGKNGGYAAEAKGGDYHLMLMEGGGSASFPCHECGLFFEELGELRLHLQSKTAWSNLSLVGCRVSCLMDSKEWQEGLVVEYLEATGKHRVVFEHMGQSRWISMLRSAFFIVRRRPPLPSSAESKDPFPSPSPHNLSSSLPPSTWTYTEDLSLDYARAQAIMHEAYGYKIQETGHKTQGHLCVTDSDRALAEDAHSSLLYGELLPRGINKALGALRLRGAEAAVVYELGMGIGKVAMQIFLQFSSTSEGGEGRGSELSPEEPGREGGRTRKRKTRLRRVYGVELSSARFVMAEAAAHRLCKERPGEFRMTEWVKGRRVVVESIADVGRGGREGAVLEMEVGNLLEVQGLETADIVLLETDLGAAVHHDLCMLLRRMKSGARAFTYLDLRDRKSVV